MKTESHIIVRCLTAFAFLVHGTVSASTSCPVISHGCYCQYTPQANATALQYVYCDNLGRLSQVPDFTISYYDTEQLTISGNTTIASLQDQAFANLKVHHLTLRGLGINEVSHVAFGGLEQTLSSIDLGQNNITVMTYDSYVRLTALTSLKLDHNYIAVLDQGTFLGLSKLNYLDLSSNQLTLQLPYNIFQDLASLVYLNLSCNTLTTFYSDQLSNCLDLQTVDISNNSLTSDVSQMSFHNYQFLVSLNLSNNQLHGTLVSSVLAGLDNLMYVDLSSNQLDGVAGDSFSGCDSLIALDLSRNNLAIIADGFLSNLPNLQWVSVADNSLRYMKADLLATLTGLRHFSSAGNELTAISSGTFVTNSRLNSIDLSSNKIEFMADDAFARNNSLWRLQLSDNAMQSVSATLLTNLTGLRYLNLSSNEIETLASGTFDFQFNLVTLDLSSNSLTGLPGGLFRRCFQLSVLILSDNQLISINGDTFDGLSVLKFLDLSDNLLQTLIQQSIPQSVQSSLVSLSLAGNPLMCDCNVEWLRHFSALDSREEIICCTTTGSCRQLVCFQAVQLNCPVDALLPVCPATTTADVTSAQSYRLTSGYDDVTGHVTSALLPVTSSQVVNSTSLSMTIRNGTSTTPKTKSSVDDSQTLSRDDVIIICVLVTAGGTAILLTSMFCVVCCVIRKRHQRSSDENNKRGTHPDVGGPVMYKQRNSTSLGSSTNSTLTGATPPQPLTIQSRLPRTTSSSNRDVTTRNNHDPMDLSLQQDILSSFL